jgi:hypothetical protein
MRILFLSLALLSVAGTTGCMDAPNKNSKTMTMMYNPPNACGHGGKADIEACSRPRGR